MIIPGIISNFNHSWFDNIFKKFGLTELFPNPSLVIVSCDVKSAKPDKEIYEVFLQRVNEFAKFSSAPEIKGHEVCLIDDKPRNLSAASESVGFVGICYNASKSPSGVLVNLLEEIGVNVSEPGYEQQT